jgi:hypothetical protein
MPKQNDMYLAKFGYYYISDSFITPYLISDSIKAIASTILGFSIFIFYYFKKSKKELFELIVLIMPVYLFMNFKYCLPWHFGIPFLLFIFIYCIHNLNKSKIINLFLVLTCFVQIFWSIKSSVYDYKEKYSDTEEVATFIKQYDYENLKIYGNFYHESAINAYFDHNIFSNWDQNIRFFYWNKNNKFYSTSLEEKDIINEKIDIYIISTGTINDDKPLLKEEYDEYIFKRATYFENNTYEKAFTHIYVKKGLNKKA